MEKEIAESIKKIHQELYPKGSLNSVFSGGNIGLIMLGKSIEKAADTIASAIRENSKDEV